MITEILAYISVGLITIGWLLTIIFDILRKIQKNAQKENKIRKEGRND